MSNTGEKTLPHLNCKFRPCHYGEKGKRHFHCHICTEFVALKVGLEKLKRVSKIIRCA